MGKKNQKVKLLKVSKVIFENSKHGFKSQKSILLARNPKISRDYKGDSNHTQVDEARAI